MTAQVPDVFEWEGSVLPVCRGCTPPGGHPGVESCATWWTPESGRVDSDEMVAWKQKAIDQRLARENERRRADGLTELAPHVVGRYRENSTDCYRGYIARWAVRDGRLVLAFIEGCHRLRDGPVLVEYTGRFTLGTGERGFAAWEPVYSHHVHLDFEAGVLRSVATD